MATNKSRTQAAIEANRKRRAGQVPKPTKKQAQATARANREATANRMKSGTGNAALDKINSQARKQQKRAEKAAKAAANVAGTINKKTGVSRSKTIGANSSKTKAAYQAQTSGVGKAEAVRTATAESRQFSNTKTGMIKAEAWLKLGRDDLDEKERARLERVVKNGGG